MTSQRRTLALVVMCVGMFLVLLDVTVVNVALPRLRADLGAGVGVLQWIVATALPVTARVVRESRARAPDVPGAALAAALLATVTFAIIAGSPAAGVAATALLAALVAAERRHTDPILPAARFRRPAFGAATPSAPR